MGKAYSLETKKNQIKRWAISSVGQKLEEKRGEDFREKQESYGFFLISCKMEDQTLFVLAQI